jgi:hypothetical protein
MNDTSKTVSIRKPGTDGSGRFARSSSMTTAKPSTRLGMLSNPLSGGNKKGLGPVYEALSTHPNTHHLEIRNLSDVLSALAELAQRGVEVVAVNGGDGTIQAVLTALFHHEPFEKLPLLAILRAGTDSAIARDIGIKGSRDQGLRKLLSWALSDNTEGIILQRSIMRVETSFTDQPRYGMIFGAAAIYQGIQFCHENIYSLGLRGKIAPSLTMGRFLVSVLRKSGDYIAPVPLEISLDKIPLPSQDYLMVLVCTLKRLYLGLHPYWGQEFGHLYFTAVRSRPKHFLRALPNLARGRQGRYGTSQNGYFSHNVDEVRLKLNSGFTLDGELYSPDSQTGDVLVNYGGQASFLVL